MAICQRLDLNPFTDRPFGVSSDAVDIYMLSSISTVLISLTGAAIPTLTVASAAILQSPFVNEVQARDLGDYRNVRNV